MRLGLAALGDIPAASKPPIDARALDVGIVHLGVGAFHRAHQAAYTQTAMALSGDSNWAICGSTQRTKNVVEQLRPQDCLYTIIERGPERTRYGVQAALREILFARDEIEPLLDRVARPTTHVVTLTVTEKGYHHDPATRRLRRDDPEIRADAAGRPPRTVVGQLVRALQRRRRLGSGPLTVVCCDNVPSNGSTLRRLVEDFCGLLPRAEGASSLAWIAEHATFPSTMVDRIVPATTAADLDEVAATLGCEDRGAVVAEPFSQWVIENSFIAPRPKWELGGAILTDDVAPYETMKLRLLNGAHSALAYLGRLAGYDYVADFMALDETAGYVRALMDFDVTPTLDVPAGFDLAQYKSHLLSRFTNPSLRYRLSQICTDGSQKLPQRLLATIRDRRSDATMPKFATLAVAAWMRYVSSSTDDAGRPLVVDDPLTPRFATALEHASSPREIVEALLGIDEIFGGDLRDDLELNAELVRYLDDLTRHGALAVVRAISR